MFCKQLMDRLSNNKIMLFLTVWVLLFIIYLPAVNSGFVGDFTGWLDQVRSISFEEFVNRKHFDQKSFYQFTQIATWVFYKIWGGNPFMWHCLHITIQSFNTLLLAILCKNIFEDSGIADAAAISLCGAVLFCISPCLSESIVWEPAYHFLQGLLFIVLILYWLQRFLRTAQAKYAWLACTAFFCSVYSLEMFYITPWLALSLIIYYRYALAWDKTITQKAFLYFFIPLISIFIFYIFQFHFVYHTWLAHIGTDTNNQAPALSFGKPAKYLFHILFLGRFFSHNFRQAVYTFCDSSNGLFIFYGLLSIYLIFIAFRFKKWSGKAKALSLLFVWICLIFGVLLPLWFPDLQLVNFDRYTIFINAFLFMFISLLFSFITIKYLKTVLFVLFACINLRYTIQVNRYWMKSTGIINDLLDAFPDPGTKIPLLLDLPDNMNGIPMIGASDESEFKLMLKLFRPEKKNISNIYDVCSFNMLTPKDGAHINVLNDSTANITLNQWGTWWWYNSFGAVSYENAGYRVNMIDEGHYYQLTLKHNNEKYLLLYQVAGKWKTVNWNLKNSDQY